MSDICLAFLSRNSFDASGLAACLGLGIHPVASDIRPLPVLTNNAILMENELRQGVTVPSDTQDRFDDWCAELNSLAVALNETWMDNRCGYLSDDSLLFKAVAPLQTGVLAGRLRQANSDGADILREFRAAKAMQGG